MPEWAWALVIGTVIIGLVGVIWRMHENHDQERNKNIWDQIGRDSKSGMREVVHDAATQILVHAGALEEMQRRIEHLERKVFNGHRQSER